MKSKENRGITLIALAMTIILLLILGGVVVSTFNNGNIIENSLSATEKAKVESMKENIQLAITSRIVKEDGDVSIEQIIDELEKKGLVDSGNSNSENGQVKTNQDGYVYEITKDSYGNWNVSYVGTGKVEEVKIAITASTSPTGISNSVTIIVNAKAKSGIKSLQMPSGEVKTYGSGNTEVTENYEVTTNGTYSFIATNNNGDGITKQVVIDNILEGTIQISANPMTPTMGDVVVTVKWPTGKYSTIQEISTNGGSSWSNYTGSQSQVTVSSNCIIKARVRNGSTEMKTATLEVTNIDKNAPIVTAKQSSVTIKEGDSNDISNYFTVSQNGTAGISSITYVDTSNNNAEVSNTNTLTVGTHTIKCTSAKETGASAYATMTIVVEETTPPIVTAKQSSITITEGDSNDIGNYFTVSQNGTVEISSITYTDTSNNNTVVSNTNTLSEGTHIIKCTATKLTGVSASATMTIVVESAEPDFSGVEVVIALADTFAEIRNVPDGYEPVMFLDSTEYSANWTSYSSDAYWHVTGLPNSGTYKVVVKFKKSDGTYCKGVIDKGNQTFTCFVAGTKIHTTNGLKNIEDIKVGDIVYSMNLETMEREETKVVQTFKNEVDYDTCLVYCGNEYIQSTIGHKYYEKEKGWTYAYLLQKGDILIDTNGNEIEVQQVERRKSTRTITVYNFEVEKNHNYFVGENGVLVHNAMCAITKE